MLIENKIDILAAQECELESEDDEKLMAIGGYCFESEKNDHKKRVGFYIKNNVKYSRRLDLEGISSHVIIIDMKSMCGKETRIIILSINSLLIRSVASRKQ